MRIHSGAYVMCSISMFTADELFHIAVKERAKGNIKEANKIMAMAYNLSKRNN